MPTAEILTALAACGVVLLYIIGALHVLHALMNARTAQGAIAWIICLITLPYLTIPFYWIFGRNKFSGYVKARKADDARLRNLAAELRGSLQVYEEKDSTPFINAAERIGGMHPVKGNRLELLINGEATFKALFHSIENAKEYILVSFFIVKNDALGQKFQDALIKKANEGVRVYFLYDDFGSQKLDHSFFAEMRAAGIECHSFGNESWLSRIQINFRNHRKIVVVDGQQSFLGGLNIGNEYLEGNERLGAWRDTYMEIDGPATLAVQLVFLEDWYWSTRDVPEISSVANSHPENQAALILPSGPADNWESWKLFIIEAAGKTKQRLWITSPYFVPDDGVLSSLQAAALRGVDVRILLPQKPDHRLVYLSSFSFYEQTLPLGIQLYRYQAGFLHQKVLLTDHHAAVGSANLDNRSFRLNFEITAFTSNPKFVLEVEEMLVQDFAQARPVELAEFEDRSFLFRAACRASRLMAPLQ